LRLGPASVEEARAEVQALASWLDADSAENEAELKHYRAMPRKLHRGEAMSLAIAQCRGWRFLTDDRAARAYAEQLGVDYSGTLGLLIYAIRQGRLTVEQGNALLKAMVIHARYRSPVQDLRALLEEDD
jgi:predicted nucleic acid-binding protein